MAKGYKTGGRLKRTHCGVCGTPMPTYRCGVCAKTYRQQYYQQHKELYIARAMTNYADNTEKRKAQVQHWRRTSLKAPGVKARSKIRRRVAEKQAFPKWANKEIIDLIYQQADDLTTTTGTRYSVDHIVPLRGKLVSGLHVEHNLRVLPLTENVSKTNKFDVSMSNLLRKHG